MIFRKKTPPGPSNINSSGSESSSNTRILTMLAQDYLKEKKSRRRWGLFFKLLILGYIVITSFFYFIEGHFKTSGEHTAVVEIEGIIGAESITAGNVNRSVANAFEAESSVAVVLKINSPGGTPVQAAQIYEEILRLKSKYPDKPVYAAISDICASGGYYIAAAADEIFAHPASIVGSIGVRMGGFGFVGAMEKLGIERRVITAGKNKAILDPFSPINPQQLAHAKTMLDNVHQQFISAVKTGRGDRLKNDPDIFSGLFWSGEKAKELGLVDQFGSTEQIARDVVGATELVDYTYRPKFIDAFADQIGAAISSALLNQSISLE